MDNRLIDITSEGDRDLAAALALIWPNAAGGFATHYRITNLKEDVTYVGDPCTYHFNQFVEDPDGIPTLILFWYEYCDETPLPYKMDELSAIPFLQGWLRNADYGQEPDHDGDNGKGWHVFSMPNYSYSFVAIQPTWAWYGK